MGFFDKFKSKKEKELKGEVVAEPAKTPVVHEATKNAKVPVSTKAKKSVREIAPKFLAIIKKPLVTEKSAHLASLGQYAFVVEMDASRISVAQAVKAVYGIMPVSVNIQRVRGKAVKFGKFSGQRKSWKKAIVTLPAGKSIDVYEGV